MFLVSVCENKHLQPPIYHPIETIEAFGHDDRSIYQDDRNNIQTIESGQKYTQNCAYCDKGYPASEENGEPTDSIRRHQDERFPIKKRNGHSFQPAEIKRRIKKTISCIQKAHPTGHQPFLCPQNSIWKPCH